jgi:hypothetical protein
MGDGRMNREQLLGLLENYKKQDCNAKELWNCCERGDWLLWIATKLEVDRKHVVKAACECAKSVLHLVPEGEERPRKAIEIALEWTEGNASLEDVRSAAAAAYAAATHANAHANASYAASYAAYAARYSAAYAVVYAAAAHAAYASAYAADNACACATAADRQVARARATHAGDVARCRSLGQCAELVRAVIPWELVEKALRVIP